MEVSMAVPRTRKRIPSMKFALWLSLASITMLFAGLLSAYIVRQAAGNWFEFTLPIHFTISTGVIVLSSIVLHLSVKAFNGKKEAAYKSLLVIAFILGLTFVVLQYQGWITMLSAGVDLKGNPSGAFVYMISGVHVAHVIAGIAAMIVAMIHAFWLPFRVTDRRLIRFDITAQYWHYVDLLWIVLYLFLTFYR